MRRFLALLIVVACACCLGAPSAQIGAAARRAARQQLLIARWPSRWRLYGPESCTVWDAILKRGLRDLRGNVSRHAKTRITSID
jgi:hypothetical protein